MREFCTSTQTSANKSLCLCCLSSCIRVAQLDEHIEAKFLSQCRPFLWISFEQILILISSFEKILDLSKTDDREGCSPAFCHHCSLKCARTKMKILYRIACDHVTKDPDVCREFQEGEDQKRTKPEHVRSLAGSLTF